jgi:hypothetical protein
VHALLLDESALALGELVRVGVLVEHVDDLGHCPGCEEPELSGRGGARLSEQAEVGDAIVATEALCRHVVGVCRPIITNECAEPHALVMLLDLRAPPSVGLRHHAPVPR